MEGTASGCTLCSDRSAPYHAVRVSIMLWKKIGLSLAILIATGMLGVLCIRVLLHGPFPITPFLLKQYFREFVFTMIAPYLLFIDRGNTETILSIPAMTALVWWIYLIIFSKRAWMVVFPIIIWVTTGTAVYLYLSFND